MNTNESNARANVHARVTNLVKLYTDRNGDMFDWLSDPYAYATWLYKRLCDGEIKVSTFKKHIDWSAQVAIDNGYPGVATVLKNIRQDSPETGNTRGAKSGRTTKASAPQKERKRDIAADIYPGDIKLLNEHLRRKKSDSDQTRLRHGDITAAWLYSGMVCGLRPSEWRTARLIRNYSSTTGDRFKWVLEVNTAHKGQVRKRDLLIRQLVLSDFSDTELEFIRRFTEMLNLPEREFKRTYQACADTLKGACKKLFNDAGRITLNSGRHLFASEVRRDRKIDRYGLAAMLGHSDSMNLKHYGDIRPDDIRRFDHTLPTPIPTAAERVEKVDRERYAIIYGKSMTDKMFQENDMGVNVE